MRKSTVFIFIAVIVCFLLFNCDPGLEELKAEFEITSTSQDYYS
jgi:hypothetical protein